VHVLDDFEADEQKLQDFYKGEPAPGLQK